MSKGILLGCGAAAALTAGAAHYYVSPAAEDVGEIPPLLVDVPPNEALKWFRSMSLEQYLQQGGVFRNQGLGQVAQLHHESGEAGEEVASLYLFSDRVLVLRAKARPVGTQTELDIVAELPDSRLTGQPMLHPHDIKALAITADLLATDYLSSLITRQRMANSGEIDDRLEASLGFDNRQGHEWSDRVKRAFEEAYRGELESIVRQAEAQSVSPSYGRPTRFGAPTLDTSAQGKQAAWEAEQAAMAASQAASDAQASAW